MAAPARGPLARHAVLSTASVEEFRQQASELLSVHSIHRISADDTSPFRGQVRAARLGDIQLVYLEQGVDMDVDILEHIDYYDLMLATAGTNEIACGKAHTRISSAHGALLSPSMRARMRMDAAYCQMHLRIERHALERRLEALLGRPPHTRVVFDLSMDLASPQLSTWTSSLRLLIRDLDTTNGLTAHPLAAASWQDLLLTGLLLAQPHTYSADLSEQSRPQLPRGVLRKALDYCEQHLADPITVGEIAQHLGISVRSLQRAFHEHLGTSPSRHIQTLRLARVRQDLLSIDPGSPESVTEIAYRWGFVHLSRFAAAYRRRYGETPSATRSRAARLCVWWSGNGEVDPRPGSQGLQIINLLICS